MAAPRADASRSATLSALRRDYFGSPASAAFTLAVVAVAAWLAWSLYAWGIRDAVFGADRIDACAGADGACWTVIARRWRIILFGLYPYADHWRAALGCAIALTTVMLACLPWFWTALRMVLVWTLGFAGFMLVVRGGAFGLDYVATTDWGGLTLTLFVYLSVIAFGLPIAIVLAIVRQDATGLLRNLVALAIDVTRSLPLVTILFAAVVMLPFLVSSELLGDKIYRVIVGFTFFFACYQSENIRAGLQSIPPGQREAGSALGMSYARIMGQIVLPQAFNASMPSTINQFVVTFKETALVAIVGLFDLLTSAQAAYNTGEFQPYYKEVLLFVAAIYFAGAFSLGRYGAFLETRIGASPSR